MFLKSQSGGSDHTPCPISLYIRQSENHKSVGSILLILYPAKSLLHTTHKCVHKLRTDTNPLHLQLLHKQEKNASKMTSSRRGCYSCTWHFSSPPLQVSLPPWSSSTLIDALWSSLVGHLDLHGQTADDLGK